MKKIALYLAAATTLGVTNANAEIPKMDREFFTSEMLNQILGSSIPVPKMVEPEDFLKGFPKEDTKDSHEIEDIMDGLLKKQAIEAQERHRKFNQESEDFLDLIDKGFLQSSHPELPLVGFYQNHMTISTIVQNKDNISPKSKEVLQKLFGELIDIYSQKISKRGDTKNYERIYDFAKEKPNIFLHMMYLSLPVGEGSIFMVGFDPETISLPNGEVKIIIIEVTGNTISISHGDFADEMIFNMQ